MAIDYRGLFTSPEQIRGQRIDRLMKEQTALKGMGGSMAGLLGQIAAGSGGMLAEGIAGIMGLQTKEEAKAAQMQDTVQNIEAEEGTPEYYYSLAESLKSIDPGASLQFLEMGKNAELKAQEMAMREQGLTLQGEQLDLQRETLGVRKEELAFKRKGEGKGYTTLSGEAAVALGFPENTVVQQGPKGQLSVLHKPSAATDATTYETVAPELVTQLGFAEGTILQQDSKGKYHVLQKPDKPKDGVTYRTLNDEETVKLGFPAGSVVQEGSNGKYYTIREAKPKDKTLEITNTVWAEDPETGETFRIGQGNDNKLYKYVNGEPVVHKGKYKPVAQVKQDIKNPVEIYEHLDEKLGKKVGDMVETAYNFETMETLLDGMEAGDPKAIAQFARSYIRLTGPDSQLSNVEIQRVMGGSDIANRITNYVSQFVKGNVTAQTVQEFRDVLEPVKERLQARLDNELTVFEQAYRERDEAYGREATAVAEDYRKRALGVSAEDELVEKYLQEVR